MKAVIQKLQQNLLKVQQTRLELECLNKPKLRTFITFKKFHEMPAYLKRTLSFAQRKIMAKLRLGCLPIRLETGRYSRPRLLENERICQVCYQSNVTSNPYIGEVEHEVHFLFNCNRYEDLRKLWLEKLTLTPDFCLLNVFQKLDIVLNHPENVKITAQYLINAYDLRSKTLINLKLCKTLPIVPSIPPTNL